VKGKRVLQPGRVSVGKAPRIPNGGELCPSDVWSSERDLIVGYF